MVAVLHAELLSLFDSTTRLYALRFKNAIPHLGAGGLLVEAFASHEALHEPGWRDVIVLSPHAHLALKTLISQPATLEVSLADGQRARYSGLVNRAARIGSDGGFARYRLRLVPWIWLLSQCATSRVWQDKRVDEIVDAIFAGYTPHAAWSWSPECAAFLQGARRRAYCNQYRETDLAFLSRILAEEGLSWRIEEDAQDGNSPAGHRVVLFADSSQTCASPEDATSASPLGGAGIRYHGARAREEQDTVCALALTQTLHPSFATVASYDHATKRVIAAATRTRMPPGGPHAPRLEAYDYTGTDTFAARDEAERHARLQMEAIEARHAYWEGRSTVRTLRPGTRFTLTQAPLLDPDGKDPVYFVTRVRALGLNNLPKPASDSLAELFGPLPDLLQESLDEDDMAGEHTLAEFAPLIALVRELGYANHFDAIPAATPWRPSQADASGMLLNPKPVALGSQTAIVVGPDGQSTPHGTDEIYCDRQGRIRIRFHWQGQHDDAAATCWVRVAQRWAGGGFGAQFLPRIGQEVLVQFFDNDIDRPVVVAALYNGQGEGGAIPTPGGARNREAKLTVFEPAHDHAVSAQGNLAGGHSPVWHGASSHDAGHRNPAAQWGIRSKEFGGNGYNQLVFDDTDQQGRIQLQSTQYASRLELGHLIHSADNYRGSFRGQGIELRTDAYGALRAARGILLTTYGIDHQAERRTPAGDNAPGIAHLKQAVQLADSFNQAAQTHQTVGLASHLGSQAPSSSKRDDTAAPLKAMLNAASGMVGDASLAAAESDAANKNTRPGSDTLPHTTDPLIHLAAKAGVGMAAGQNIQFALGETASVMSGADTQFITGGAWRLHTGQAIGMLAGAVAPGENSTGLQLIAAKGEIDLQAQSGTLDIKAKELVDIISANSHIDWAAAKSISLSTAGGANITIADGNITVQCPGKILVQAGKKSLVGPERKDYPLPTLPGNVCISCLLKAKAQGAPLAAKTG
ncbi:MAG TPA: type VI secretion system Vgr family protein [Noviherbaspirillum sp.]